MKNYLLALAVFMTASMLVAATTTYEDVTGITAGGGGATFSTETVTVNGGGTLTYTTDYSRYALVGNLMIWQFQITQTAAGSGTTAITIDLPAGITISDKGNVGSASTLDMFNGNDYLVYMPEIVSDKIKFRPHDGANANYLRGGAFIGNNGTVSLSVTIIAEID